MTFVKRRVLVPLLMLIACGVGGAVVVPDDATQTVRQAGRELTETLETIGAPAPDYFLLIDRELKPEEWRIRPVAGGIELAGGDERGVFYAVNHYLEEVCTVRFWNPHETGIPRLSVLPPLRGELRGRPAFRNRDIYSVYGNDRGRFSVRSRLNGDGNRRIEAEYGGGTLFGPPYNCHTFNFYVPVTQYFKEHPEWFAEINGKRTAGAPPHNSQLCLTNPQLREFMKKRLREFIEQGNAGAKKRGETPPSVYDISQNDNQQYCRCSSCSAIADREGAQTGVLLDFINDIARSIRQDFPEIQISTLIYQYTEKLPRTIRPDDNVLIVLCDTLSNSSMPLTERANPYFYNLLRDWADVTENIRIWDYAITFKEPRGLPYNSEWTYGNDMKLFRDRKVTQIFTELEEPILADARDYKVYLRARATENPDVDFEALSRDFANGFYGKAGPLFLEYRELLKQSQLLRKPHINMFPPADAFTHLDLETVSNAQKLFARGEELLAGDETRLKRWRHARLGIDRATLARKRTLMGEYFLKHGSFDQYPFEERPILARIRRCWEEQAAMRLEGKELKSSLAQMEKELAAFGKPIPPKTLNLPSRFADLPRHRVTDFTADMADCYKDVLELVDAPDAESGIARRLTFPNKGGEEHQLEKYKLPIVFGIYSPTQKKNLWAKQITAAMVKPGFHWYKLGQCRLSPDALMFLTWSWYATFQVNSAFDPNWEDAEYEVWICAKFTGPAYPGSRTDEPNAIYFERVCLIRVP